MVCLGIGVVERFLIYLIEKDNIIAKAKAMSGRLYIHT
jgi:hypothetical protein